MGLMAVALVLEGTEHKVVVDVGGKGVNGEVMYYEVLPKVFKHFGIEYLDYNTSGFRYYLGQSISKLTINTKGGDVLEGHLVTSKVMSSNVLEV